MKRSAAKAELADPGPFLRDYFYRHEMDGSAECSLSHELIMRAEEAREEFKRIRLDHSPDSDGATTGEQKYNRRLANNRNSAAASRVFREVLKKEQEYALKRASLKTTQLEQQLKRLEQENTEMCETLGRLQKRAEAKHEQENARLRERLAELEALLEKNAAAEKVPTLRLGALDQENVTPGSPILEACTPPLKAMPPLQLGAMVPALFCSSLSEKDVVRYGGVLPRNSVTPRDSLTDADEGGLTRPADRPVFGELHSDDAANLRLSLSGSFPAGLFSSQGSLQLGLTQESQRCR